MLREELAFRIRMRNSLRTIQHLDPEAIAARLAQFDCDIEALEARIAKEKPAPRMDVVQVGARVKAA